MHHEPEGRSRTNAGWRRSFTALGALTIFLVGRPLLAQSTDGAAMTKELSARAEVVFRGTVRLVNASTVGGDDSTGLVVVRVNEVLSGSEIVKKFSGKDVTVHLKEGSTAKADEERVFFADVWHFGESLGLVELGSYVAPAAAAHSMEVKDGVAKARQVVADNDLKERLANAQLVVAGRVAAVKKAAPRFVTEHDPQWTEAQIAVSEVVKGNAPGNRVTVMFPGSTDVMWYQTPKPKVGQQGVWILRSELKGLAAPQTLGVVEQGDQLPISELPRVKALIVR